MPKWKQGVLVALLVAASFFWYAVFATHVGATRVAVLDVGQGDAIFIESANGTQILIDGGPGTRVLAELSRVMPWYDKSIDVVIATHTDFDHIAGLVEVARKYQIGEVLENGLTADTRAYKDWDAVLREKNIKREVVRVGDRLVIDPQTRLDILGPFPDDFSPPPKKANEAMVVSRLVDGARSFLFMGDIERGDELRLAMSGLPIHSDVLKVAHHGSRYSSTSLFLENVAPRFAVISVGAGNRYGHPHAETLERLAALGSGLTLFRTDKDGTRIFRSDGSQLAVE